jgi:hypothetical protein
MKAAATRSSTQSANLAMAVCAQQCTIRQTLKSDGKVCNGPLRAVDFHEKRPRSSGHTSPWASDRSVDDASCFSVPVACLVEGKSLRMRKLSINPVKVASGAAIAHSSPRANCTHTDARTIVVNILSRSSLPCQHGRRSFVPSQIRLQP